jgi:hypothetical protein
VSGEAIFAYDKKILAKLMQNEKKQLWVWGAVGGEQLLQ